MTQAAECVAPRLLLCDDSVETDPQVADWVTRHTTRYAVAWAGSINTATIKEKKFFFLAKDPAPHFLSESDDDTGQLDNYTAAVADAICCPPPPSCCLLCNTAADCHESRDCSSLLPYAN